MFFFVFSSFPFCPLSPTSSPPLPLPLLPRPPLLLPIPPLLLPHQLSHRAPQTLPSPLLHLDAEARALVDVGPVRRRRDGAARGRAEDVAAGEDAVEVFAHCGRGLGLRGLGLVVSCERKEQDRGKQNQTACCVIWDLMMMAVMGGREGRERGLCRRRLLRTGRGSMRTRREDNVFLPRSTRTKTV